MRLRGYSFQPGQRCILAEIYLPFRVSTQGAIFDALRDGLDQAKVRTYFEHNAENVRKELNVYPHWFDPSRYGDETEYQTDEARTVARLNQYEQVFYGWSEYEVNGVFAADNGRIDEERTQVIRLIFRFSDDESDTLVDNDSAMQDVYRAIQYWLLSEYGHTADNLLRGEDELAQFVQRHQYFTPEQRAFARTLFPLMARKVTKWIDDAGLFVFGYLVRSYWEKTLQLEQKYGDNIEDEIWVTSIFHLNVNVLQPLSTRT